MEQMELLGNMDPRRLKDNPTHNQECYTHECERCGKLITMPWKVRGYLANTGLGGTGSYHATNATRHL